MNVELTYVTDVQGDWAALYADGVDSLVCQNHSLDLHAVLTELVGYTITDLAHFEVDSEEGFAGWLGDRGFPHNLSDIPKEARIPCKS